MEVHGLDLAVLLVYLGAVVALGVWLGRGTRDLSGFLLGARNLPWWAVLGSIVATETSTATFLSIPGLAWESGGNLEFLQLAIGYIIGRGLIVLVLLPQYFRGELYTAYEVLKQRFGGATQRVASVMFLVARNLGDGLRLYLAAVVLEQMTGASLPQSILVVGLATIVYTVFGGMKSVVWNDCIQLVVYVAGGVLTLFLITNRLPEGWSQLFAFAETHGKTQIFDFSWNPKEPLTLWAGVIGGMFLTLGTHGADQMMVQRYLCARSQKDAARALALSGIVVLLQFVLFLFVGVALAAFFNQYPTTQTLTKDNVFASFIVSDLPRGVGVVGIILAAVFAAAMSTLSSSLHSSATATIRDLFPARNKDEPESPRLLRTSRLLALLFGCVQMLVALGATAISQSVVSEALAIASFTGGVLLGVFALGIWNRRVGQNAALVGMVAGILCVAGVRYYIAWPWWTIVGAVTTFGIGSLVAEILPRRVPEEQK